MNVDMDRRLSIGIIEINRYTRPTRQEDYRYIHIKGPYMRLEVHQNNW